MTSDITPVKHLLMTYMCTLLNLSKWSKYVFLQDYLYFEWNEQLFTSPNITGCLESISLSRLSAMPCWKMFSFILLQFCFYNIFSYVCCSHMTRLHSHCVFIIIDDERFGKWCFVLLSAPNGARKLRYWIMNLWFSYSFDILFNNGKWWNYVKIPHIDFTKTLVRYTSDQAILQ